jgi:hypothetical protein
VAFGSGGGRFGRKREAQDISEAHNALSDLVTRKDYDCRHDNFSRTWGRHALARQRISVGAAVKLVEEKTGK